MLTLKLLPLVDQDLLTAQSASSAGLNNTALRSLGYLDDLRRVAINQHWPLFCYDDHVLDPHS